jgi:integrase
VAQLWADHVAVWQTYPPTDGGTGPWLFTTNPSRAAPLTPSGLRQRFDKIVTVADVPGACLHRIRHTVGSYLVGQGKILKAAGRLRHRDPSTTLRNYADALPLDDEDVADLLDDLYRDPPPTSQPETNGDWNSG